MTDTSTDERRATVASVKPKRGLIDQPRHTMNPEPAIARVVRQMADAMRQPYSIAFALQKRGLCADWTEASKVVLRWYPWP